MAIWCGDEGEAKDVRTIRVDAGAAVLTLLTGSGTARQGTSTNLAPQPMARDCRAEATLAV
jgi:hypothetical protein